MVGEIIIDANVAHEFPRETAEAESIVKWLQARGRLATGGKNLEELLRAGKIRVLIVELLRAGRAFSVDKDNLAKCESKIVLLEIQSDDPHILALAIVSKARVLYTKDLNLIRDFTNSEIISKPKGKCYSNAAKHTHLLK